MTDPLLPPPLPPPLPPGPTAAVPAIPEPSYTVLAFPLACIQCDYNLEGLSLDGVCPECGTPIARSASGDLLVFTPIEDVRRIDRGVRDVVRGLTIFISTLAFVAVLAMGMAAFAPSWPLPGAWIWPRVAFASASFVALTWAVARHLRGWLALAQPVRFGGQAVPLHPSLPLLRLAAIGFTAALSALYTLGLAMIVFTPPGMQSPQALLSLMPVVGVVVTCGFGVFWTLACLVVHTLLLKVPMRQRAAKLKTVTWTMLPTLAVIGFTGFGAVSTPLVPCALVVIGAVWLLVSFSRALDALLDLARVLPRLVAAKEDQARRAVGPDS